MLESFGLVNVWTYVLGAVFIILVPGPNTIFVLSTSVRQGIKKGYQAAIGVFLGDAILVFLAFIGLASVVSASPVLFSIIKYAGAGYLFYLGGRLLVMTFRSVNPSVGEIGRSSAEEQVFKKALVLSLTNPKAILFYVSFFIQFINPVYMHSGMPFFILAVILEVISFIYMSILIWGGATLATMFKESKGLAKWANSLVGSLFLGFGLKLAMVAS